MQLELFPTVRITAHVRQPNKTWQIHEVGNIQGNLNKDAVKDLHKKLTSMFPNQQSLILIQNV